MCPPLAACSALASVAASGAVFGSDALALGFVLLGATLTVVADLPCYQHSQLSRDAKWCQTALVELLDEVGNLTSGVWSCPVLVLPWLS